MSQLVINILDKALKSKGNKLKKQNEYMYWSPFVTHHKQKLQVNIETGKWHCWVSNQGGHNLFQLLKQVSAPRELFKELSDAVGSKYYSSNNKDKKQITLSLPKEWKPLWNGGDSVQKLHALKFVYERGLTDEDIVRYNLGYCLSGVYQNRIIIPSYDSDGQLNYFVGRDFYSGGMKYKNPPVPKDIVGFDLYINWDEPLILCEGVFDAIAIKNNSLPLFGKTILPKLKEKIIENRVRHIYIALDNDAFKDSLKIISDFIDMGIDVNFINLNVSDPSELGYDKMISKIDTSKEMNFKNLMELKLYGNKQKHMEIR
jgi:DNA primase|tara:strand:- start:441 stop:1385 length:945 start_codon:yes stop_codon:yes gene_type:complete